MAKNKAHVLRVAGCRRSMMMEPEIRRALDDALTRLAAPHLSPALFAGQYAFTLGMVAGGCACGALGIEETAELRARLLTLSLIFGIKHKLPVRVEPSELPKRF
jgi:hypothetical protein